MSEKNILLAGVSALTYSATQIGCNNKNIVIDSLTFGVINGVAQQITPQLVDNKDVQSLFIDPLIASIAQGIISILAYDQPFRNGSIIAKSIVAGVSASALTLHMYGRKLY